ncbi:MAG: NAD-dependent epimerase/dehydratase family protein [Planctomycetes bacterium]|nr:NAD-dependent epimerase/dehydratase family protein [Planctomycetota bacterium]
MRSTARGLANSRVLVTGATGFIGRRLVQRLRDLNVADLRLLVRNPARARDLEDSGILLFQGDLASASALRAAGRGCDFVFHLAALTRARSREEMFQANAEGTGTLARIVREVAPDLRRFVHVSSLAAVGPSRRGAPVDERAACQPGSWYGASKWAAERLLESELAEAIPWTIVRPPAVYGPGERDLLTMFKLVKRGMAPLLGSGPKELSFVYSEDLVEALVRVAVAEPCARGRFFVAHPEIATDESFLDAIGRAMGTRFRRPRLPSALGWGLGAINSCFLGPFLRRPPLMTWQRMKELAPSAWTCSPLALEKALDWRCPTGLAEGVPATLTWYRDQNWL